MVTVKVAKKKPASAGWVGSLVTTQGAARSGVDKKVLGRLGFKGEAGPDRGGAPDATAPSACWSASARRPTWPRRAAQGGRRAFAKSAVRPTRRRARAGQGGRMGSTSGDADAGADRGPRAGRLPLRPAPLEAEVRAGLGHRSWAPASPGGRGSPSRARRRRRGLLGAGPRQRAGRHAHRHGVRRPHQRARRATRGSRSRCSTARRSSASAWAVCWPSTRAPCRNLAS